jgi:hypothetical protein
VRQKQDKLWMSTECLGDASIHAACVTSVNGQLDDADTTWAFKRQRLIWVTRIVNNNKVRDLCDVLVLQSPKEGGYVVAATVCEYDNGDTHHRVIGDVLGMRRIHVQGSGRIGQSAYGFTPTKSH